MACLFLVNAFKDAVENVVIEEVEEVITKKVYSFPD